MTIDLTSDDGEVVLRIDTDGASRTWRVDRVRISAVASPRFQLDLDGEVTVFQPDSPSAFMFDFAPQLQDAKAALETAEPILDDATPNGPNIDGSNTDGPSSEEPAATSDAALDPPSPVDAGSGIDPASVTDPASPIVGEEPLIGAPRSGRAPQDLETTASPGASGPTLGADTTAAVLEEPGVVIDLRADDDAGEDDALDDTGTSERADPPTDGDRDHGSVVAAGEHAARLDQMPADDPVRRDDIEEREDNALTEPGPYRPSGDPSEQAVDPDPRRVAAERPSSLTDAIRRHAPHPPEDLALQSPSEPDVGARAEPEQEPEAETEPAQQVDVEAAREAEAQADPQVKAEPTVHAEPDTATRENPERLGSGEAGAPIVGLDDAEDAPESALSSGDDTDAARDAAGAAFDASGHDDGNATGASELGTEAAPAVYGRSVLDRGGDRFAAIHEALERAAALLDQASVRGSTKPVVTDEVDAAASQGDWSATEPTDVASDPDPHGDEFTAPATEHGLSDTHGAATGAGTEFEPEAVRFGDGFDVDADALASVLRDLAVDAPSGPEDADDARTQPRRSERSREEMLSAASELNDAIDELLNTTGSAVGRSPQPTEDGPNQPVEPEGQRFGGDTAPEPTVETDPDREPEGEPEGESDIEADGGSIHGPSEPPAPPARPSPPMNDVPITDELTDLSPTDHSGGAGDTQQQDAPDNVVQLPGRGTRLSLSEAIARAADMPEERPSIDGISQLRPHRGDTPPTSSPTSSPIGGPSDAGDLHQAPEPTLRDPWDTITPRLTQSHQQAPTDPAGERRPTRATPGSDESRAESRATAASETGSAAEPATETQSGAQASETGGERGEMATPSTAGAQARASVAPTMVGDHDALDDRDAGDASSGGVLTRFLSRFRRQTEQATDPLTCQHTWELTDPFSGVETWTCNRCGTTSIASSGKGAPVGHTRTRRAESELLRRASDRRRSYRVAERSDD